MPPRERQHEELGGWGVVSHARERTARGGFCFERFFHTFRRDGTRKEGLGCVWRFLLKNVILRYNWGDYIPLSPPPPTFQELKTKNDAKDPPFVV